MADEEDAGMASDAEDEDEEDPDGMLEADLDKNELIDLHSVDHVGDQFLQVHYSTSSADTQRKRRVC